MNVLRNILQGSQSHHHQIPKLLPNKFLSMAFPCSNLAVLGLFLIMYATFTLLFFTSQLGGEFVPEIANNETDWLNLLDFKARINDPFGFLISWNSSTHLCQWHGVTCGHKHVRVTILNLKSCNLSGPLSPNIGNLNFLRKLNLPNNRFTQEIPLELGKLKKLRYINLEDNSFRGEIPSSLSSCSKLVNVSLARNQLVGSIPSSFSSLQNLKILDVSGNNLTGKIPEFLQKLNLLYLNLSYNNFQGEVPTEGSFKNASAISVSGNNKLCGGIPELHLLVCNVSDSNYHKLATKLKLVIFVLCGVLGVTTLFAFLCIWVQKRRKASKGKN